MAAAAEVTASLRDLCGGGRWSYGVLWRYDSSDPRLLKFSENWHEQNIRAVVDRMRKEVHVGGEGSVGVVATSGTHRWLLSDIFREGSHIETSSSTGILQGSSDCSYQFAAGLKTIVIVPLPSLGVIQFGSFTKILENQKFITQVQSIFQNNCCVERTFKQEACASTISSLNCNPWKFEQNKLLSDCRLLPITQIGRAECTSTSVLSAAPSYLESNFGCISNFSDQNVHVFAMPIASSPACRTNELADPIREGASSRNMCKLTSQCVEGRIEQELLSPNLQLSHGLQSLAPLMNSLNSCPNKAKLNQENSLPVLEHRQSLGSPLQDLTGCRPMKCHSAVTGMSTSDQPRGTSCSSNISYACIPVATSLASSRDFRQDAGMPCKQVLSTSLNVNEGSLAVDNSSAMGASCSTKQTDKTARINKELAAGESASPHSKENQNNDRLEDHAQDNVDLFTSLFSICGDGANDFIETSAPSCRRSNNSVADAMKLLGSQIGEDDSFTASQPPSNIFEGIELDISRNTFGQDHWNDMLMPMSISDDPAFSLISSESNPKLDAFSLEETRKGLYSDSGLDQLLDAVVCGTNMAPSQSCVTQSMNSVTSSDTEQQFSTSAHVTGTHMFRDTAPLVGLHCCSQKDTSLPSYKMEASTLRPSSDVYLKSHASSWISDSYSMNAHGSVINQSKKPEGSLKIVRRRARPGESSRPRPKDRQQIQDRVKELREIVPNGAKCSIDSLLDRTIRHMLYLQSMTKYADKLKLAGEPKIIGDESGVVLKDNSNNDSHGATWAYEVAGQTMVCPIIVEDVSPPGQMLVEMLCEDHGFFLEIADTIRGFGLTILKGIMEMQCSKIWARFLVEANKNVTRMDIFLSLVKLLQQTAHGKQSTELQNKAVTDMVRACPAC